MMSSSCYEVNSLKRRRIGDHDVQLGQEHEVFLSFRGTDTRKGFTDHLYRSLCRAGVRAFRDNENLHVGEEIGLQLLQGIEQSKISIPIFSQNYAESKWCLKEFTLMMECRKTMKQIVLPIFYDVTPEEVKNQTGKFLEALVEHESSYGADTVQQWRKALSEGGSLKGWELEKAAAGHEAELVDMVVKDVLEKLKKAHVVLKENVIGMEEQVNAVIELLVVGANDVRVVGICGMGGIGKTTLAKAVYNQIVDQFDYYCFLESIREKSSHPNGLESLLSVLVSKLSDNKGRDFKMVDDGIKELKDRFHGKKVLIVLDDVDKKNQLETLGGKVHWFGRGSRIIVTTRDSLLFDKSKDKIYQTKLMDRGRALQLFCNHAFKTYSPPAELRGLSKDIVDKIGGLPLSLEVIGGLLAGEERDFWVSVHQKLQDRSHEEFEDTLKISYNALTEIRKYIFLDIACFHIRENVNVANYMRDDKFGSALCDVRILEGMSLIKIDRNGNLWMHDHLRDFGRAVVERDNEESSTKRIWLWESKTAAELLEERTESPRVEAICLPHTETHFTDDQFRYLPKLRLIRLFRADLSGNFQHLLSNLRWLDWQHAPFMRTLTDLTLKNLVVLNLSHSCVRDDWNWSSMQVVVKLKALDLTGCPNLRKAPNFSFFPNLERLQLRRCSKLTEVNPSIGKLKSLKYLNLWGCRALEKLPREMRSLQSLVELDVSLTKILDLPISRHMKKLRILHAIDCRKLASVPDFIGELTSLTDLQLTLYAIQELPVSIGLLQKLERLSLKNSSILKLPESIGQLTSLVELDLRESRISAFPRSIGNLEKLKVLDASNCPPLLGEFPDIGRLCDLEVLKVNCVSVRILPEAITSLSRLHTLHLSAPTNYASRGVYVIPRLEISLQLPVSLISITLTCCSAVPIPNIFHLTNLKELVLHSCTGMTELSWDFARPLKLQKLRIVACPKLKHIIALPTALSELVVDSCSSLESIQGLECLISLKRLDLCRCKSLQTLPNMSKLKTLERVCLLYMEELQKLEGLESLEVLEELDITGCAAINKLSGFSNLKSLYSFDATDCKSLSDLDGLDALGELKKLRISGCEAIEKLPNLTDLKSLEELYANYCNKLRDLEGLDGLEALRELSIAGCKGLEQLPDLSHLACLCKVNAKGCEKLQQLGGLEDLKALQIEKLIV